MKRTRVTAVLKALGIRFKVKGLRAWALCPYHEDHTPSWFATTDKGGHHCFSCKKGGSLAELVKHVRGCSMREAIDFVKARGEGFEPPKKTVQVFARPAQISTARYKLPREVKFKPFKDWPDVIREYAEGRHIDEDQVERFGLGYSVFGKLGARLVFPVRDRRGRPASYSARDITGAAEQRYLTPHESEGADLNVMFGEHLWLPRGAGGEPGRGAIIVTEGAANTLACYRAFRTRGRDHRVSFASMGGSDVRPQHVTKLATFDVVIILTDPDDAGDKAAGVLHGALGRTTRTWRPRLPKGKDADTIKGDELFRILWSCVPGGRGA